ncbi:hypothetical protein K431DRAFT_280576, partial [Polychaeton citri CBS 116435]
MQLATTWLLVVQLALEGYRGDALGVDGLCSSREASTCSGSSSDVGSLHGGPETWLSLPGRRRVRGWYGFRGQGLLMRL